MNPSLITLSGPLKGQSIELAGEPVEIGRHPSSSVQIPDLAVSRHHCVLEPNGQGWRLRDLGSSDGTFVNGKAVQSIQVRPGDLILVAGSTFLLAQPEVQAPASEPTPGREKEPPTMPELRELTINGTTRRLAMTSTASIEEIAQTMPVNRALAALVRLGAAAGARRTVASLAQELLDQTFKAVRADRAALLITSDGLEIERSFYHPDTASAPFVLSKGIVEQVVQERQAILISEAESSGSGAETEGITISSLAAVPLQVNNQLLAVLYLDVLRRGASLTQQHLELLVAIATITAAALADAMRIERLEDENRRLQESGLGGGLIGRSSAMQKVLRLISRAAPTASTILILGPSGTGKELAARLIHACSPRAARPFVAINCASLSESLLESELFGHERGAFTGALERKAGKLELADGGTVLLDEVGELPQHLQAKLLRVLQERSFERVGGVRPITVDVRLIAATNRDLQQAVSEGHFRDDLFYRLNVITLRMPPLRDRREDIALLANHLARVHGNTIRHQPAQVSAAALAVLEAHDWPGNVRELSNAIERAIVLGADGLIRPEDLPEHLLESRIAARSAGTSYHDALVASKQRIIADALRQTTGNVTHAAQRLGLHPSHLHRLMTSLGLREQLA